MKDERLRGVFVPVVTPFDKDDVRLDWLERNLEKLNGTAVSGYLALGSNGEFASLSEEEQLAVVKVFAKKRDRKTLMVGTARESTKLTIEFSKKAIDLGADFVSVLPPHYFAKNIKDDVLVTHYTRVAEAVSVPLLVYNAPQFAAGIHISAEVIRTLSQHPNILGMKDSSPAGMNSYLSVTRNGSFSVLAGSADFYYSALLLGATGGIISMANYLPALCCDFHHSITGADHQKAADYHRTIFDINRRVSGKHGVAGVKAAMNLLGFRGGDPRMPLFAIGNAERDAIRECLDENGLL